MNWSLKRESPHLVIMLLPLIYLAYLWPELPEQVPVHWNLEGQANNFGNKTMLLFIVSVLTVFIYFIFLFAPYLDPKKKIKQMGNKYNNIRFAFTFLQSMTAILVVYSAQQETLVNLNLIVLIIGLFSSIFGNYFKVIRPNYFIGIRTPWTLKSDSVWKDTHIISGKLWFVCGLVIVFLSLVLEQKLNYRIFLMIITVMVVVPVGYSYVLYRRLKAKE